MEWKDKRDGDVGEVREALDFIENNRIYKNIFKSIYNKYKKYGKITGSFSIYPKNDEDVKVLMNFDISVITDRKATIRSKVVQELFENKFKNIDFLELLEEVVGKELITNKEVKENETNKLKNFYGEVIKESDEGYGKRWFIYVVSEKSKGYSIIKKRYNDKSESTNKLKLQLIYINNCLSNLPYIKGEKENISVFSAQLTKNPHFLDYDKFTGKLFIYGLQFITRLEIDISRVVNINELYYKVGILKDEISNHSTIYNLDCYDYNNMFIEHINEFFKWGETLELSIRNILKIEYFIAKRSIIYIFENPAVFNEVQKRTIKDDVSLMCTSGQINLSSYLILDKIKDIQKIYYAGDFDPEGLIIADKIADRYGDKVEFLFYDVDTFNEIISSKKIDEKRISMLNNIKSPKLKKITDAIREKKLAAYQELLIDKYVNYIENN